MGNGTVEIVIRQVLAKALKKSWNGKMGVLEYELMSVIAGVELKQQRARQHQQGAVLLLSSVSTQSPLASMNLIRIFTLRMLIGSCDIVQHKHSKWRLVCRWRRLEQRC